MADEDLVTTKSAWSAAETMDRLAKAIEARGIRVFARIDHSGGAAAAAMPLRFTQVLIFGNAKAGTPLMQSRQTAGIDLPLRLLVWEDEAANAWVSYRDPRSIAQAHGITDREVSVQALAAALEGLARSVSARPE